MNGVASAHVRRAAGAFAVLSAALLAPDFLFRASPAGSPESSRAQRLVEQLSYALWDAPPDAELSFG